MRIKKIKLIKMKILTFLKWTRKYAMFVNIIRDMNILNVIEAFSTRSGCIYADNAITIVSIKR